MFYYPFSYQLENNVKIELNNSKLLIFNDKLNEKRKFKIVNWKVFLNI